ncbi:unnamed protein product [Psylliodes chrysocephalus]|uniref:HAT C-terminal dimerisation domain-containing protein n=1 Tax=Psylliodes chrysocephalus TaxID=3402493 RepID=A0A9P0CZ36_9CUCU|nr:unnamed protein product [Psylliodes chrysocephala]
MTHLNLLEKFVIGEDDDSEYVSEFYKSDVESERLKLHRNTFLDNLKSRNIKVSCISDITNILKQEENDFMLKLSSECVQFIKIILTIPVTSCTPERSFSALRRLETYLDQE